MYSITRLARKNRRDLGEKKVCGGAAVVAAEGAICMRRFLKWPCPLRQRRSSKPIFLLGRRALDDDNFITSRQRKAEEGQLLREGNQVHHAYFFALCDLA